MYFVACNFYLLGWVVVGRLWSDWLCGYWWWCGVMLGTVCCGYWWWCGVLLGTVCCGYWWWCGVLLGTVCCGYCFPIIIVTKLKCMSSLPHMLVHLWYCIAFVCIFLVFCNSPAQCSARVSYICWGTFTTWDLVNYFRFISCFEFIFDIGRWDLIVYVALLPIVYTRYI